MGKRSRSRRVAWGSSPRAWFVRTRAGGWSSTERAELGEERQWRRRSAARFRPGDGPNEVGEVLQRCGVRLGRLWREETGLGGESWSAQSSAAARARPGSAQARGRRKGRWNGGWASRTDKEASARRARIVDGRRVEEAPTATVAGMAGELHRVEHRRSTVSSFE